MGREKNSIARMLERDVEKTLTCWNWMGFADQKGFMRTRVGGKYCSPRYLFYAHFKGALPEGRRAVIAPTCGNRLCVNPDHLELRVRQTHCLRGHPLSGQNLYVRRNGGHECRACLAKAAVQFRKQFRA